MKKINTLIAILVMLFAVSSLRAQTYPVPKMSLHIYGGYAYTLPDLHGDFPADIDALKDPTPYFVNSGFNFGVDGKYFVDKKSTFGIMLSFMYTGLSSGNLTFNNDPILGTGTFKTDLNIFTIGLGAEYDFAPKRPANPFVNAQFTTNIFSGTTTLTSTDSAANFTGDLQSAVRFGAQFGAGVDVKLSKKIGVIIGGRYCYQNLFNKNAITNSSGAYGLNDAAGTQKAKKIAYLQFYAGISFYFGQKTYPKMKK